MTDMEANLERSKVMKPFILMAMAMIVSPAFAEPMTVDSGPGVTVNISSMSNDTITIRPAQLFCDEPNKEIVVVIEPTRVKFRCETKAR